MRLYSRFSRSVLLATGLLLAAHLSFARGVTPPSSALPTRLIIADHIHAHFYYAPHWHLHASKGHIPVKHLADGTWVVGNTVPKFQNKSHWWQAKRLAPVAEKSVNIGLPHLMPLVLSPTTRVSMRHMPVHHLNMTGHQAILRIDGATHLTLSMKHGVLIAAVSGGRLDNIMAMGDVSVSARQVSLTHLVAQVGQQQFLWRGRSQLVYWQGTPDAITTLLRGGQVSTLATQGMVTAKLENMHAASDLNLNDGLGKYLLMRSHGVHIHDATVSPRMISLAATQGQVSQVKTTGDVRLHATAWQVPTNIKWSSDHAQGVLRGDHLLLPDFSLTKNRVKTRVTRGQLSSLKAQGSVWLTGQSLSVAPLFVRNNAGAQLQLTAHHAALPSLTVTPATITATLTGGQVNALNNVGRVTLKVNHTKITGRPAVLHANGSDVLRLSGQAYVSQLLSSPKGIAVTMEKGQLSIAKASGHAVLSASDVKTNQLQVENSQNKIAKLSGQFHVNKLNVSPKQLHISLADHARLSHMTLVGAAALSGNDSRAKGDVVVNRQGYGVVTFAGDAKVHVSKNKNGAETVELSQGKINHLVVSGRLAVAGHQLTSDHLTLIDHSSAPVHLNGVMSVDRILADKHSDVKIQWVNSGALQIDASDYAHIDLSGRADQVFVTLLGHATLAAPYLRGQNWLVRTSGAAQAEVLPIFTLRAFAGNKSNIYYYMVPHHLTASTRSHGNVLYVLNKRALALELPPKKDGLMDVM